MTRAEAGVVAVSTRDGDDPLVQQLRSAGCVFAEDEAAILRECASGDDLAVLCRRRVSGEPLEHVVGWVEFEDLRLNVGPGVFVPRQRSRLIARLAVAEVGAALAARSPSRTVVVEAFAGVAPIAASVVRSVPSAQAHVSDVDGEALRYARMNVGDGAGVYHGPSLAAMPNQLRREVDVIAAVPPYAPTTAADLLSRESDYEPPTALFGGIDGLDHVRSLIDQAPDWLASSGCLLIEMNKRQSADPVAHAERASFTATRRNGEDGQTTVLTLRI